MSNSLLSRNLSSSTVSISRCSRTHLHSRRVCVNTYATASTAPTTSRATAGEARPAEYAIISTPTGQQLVEEGKWFALSSTKALQATSGEGQLRFPAVAVKRTDGEFMKGRPFLADWVVEAELVDGQVFALQAGSSTDSSNTLGKVLVTRIKHTDETRRLLEEALVA